MSLVTKEQADIYQEVCARDSGRPLSEPLLKARKYQRQCRVYSDEIKMADLSQSRFQEAIENGYDGLLLFKTDNPKDYAHYANTACPPLNEKDFDKAIKALEGI